jgi:HSP20 family molecular chaperone IbpA
MQIGQKKRVFKVRDQESMVAKANFKNQVLYIRTTGKMPEGISGID